MLQSCQPNKTRSLYRVFANGWNSGDSTPSKPPAHPTSQLPPLEDDDFKFGGFGDEDGGDHERLSTIDNPTKPLKIKSIAAVVQMPASIVKIEPTTSVPELVTPTAKRRKDIRLRDLPKEAALKLGQVLRLPKLQELWEDSMPAGIHDQYLVLNTNKAIEVLIHDKLNVWHNSIGKSALKALKTLFSRENILTADQCKAYVARQLEGTYKSYPYYYSHAVGEVKNVQYAGPFQSYLISRTFAEHLKAIDGIPADDRREDRPTGALVLAILAVHCALTFYLTGCKVVPIGSDGHFSQAVWGNKSAIVEGVKKQFKTTLNLHLLFKQNPVKKIDRTLPPAQLEPQSDEDWELPDIDPNSLTDRMTSPATEQAPELQPEGATSLVTAVAGTTGDNDQPDGMVEDGTGGGDSDDNEERGGRGVH
ncbi:hypothetical protein BT96DRAFT_1003013 [Gymnopus androsaceus JB14]|uniref:Uncharacterized protein n=1 Tax=Gymnopus androsaceus JB14 TaxID=1447944 RepID=A0A6A4GUZ4_9AGAR|nr:hypothetical protein BT96DRAFT_1003013 [Gymnopus androsaceus JB14]